MLALLIGLLVSAGPLLRGSWDIWAQSALFIVVAAGTTVWLIGRVFVGYVPLPSNRLLVWASLLAALSGLAAYGSPIASYAVPSWRALLLGLWVFAAIAVSSKDERAAVDQAVRVAAWVLVLLAFYQHYRYGMERPPSALLNQNVFAGSILMLLPLAAQQRDWFLATGLLVCLWWAHSVGAWMGLAGALVVARPQRDSVGHWTGMTILFVCAVLVYGKLQSPDVIHRWHWWRGALAMIAAQPLLGFGPGSYAYVVPSFLDVGQNLSTLYAHQHFLETAAECGLPYLAVWIAGLVYFLRRGAPHKRFGALAVLIQSLWDYPLSMAGLFWLFCYFAASTIAQTSRGVNVPHARKLPCALASVAVCVCLCYWAGVDWQADRLKALAVESFKAGEPPSRALRLLDESLRLSENPEAARSAAEILLSGRPPTHEAARAAAEHLERAAALNPYRASTWIALERLYGELGEPEKGRLLRERGEAYCPILRREAGR